MSDILSRLREHPDAPRWNHSAGDRLEEDDLVALDRFREELEERRGPWTEGPPPPAILRRIAAQIETVPLFRARCPSGLDLERRWYEFPTTSREDIAISIDRLVPEDADLERLIVYRTAGTTGHALVVPHHPRAAAAYQVLIEHALDRHGRRLALGPETVACFLVGAQARTVTYPTVLTAWGGAGFAKLNLNHADWPKEQSPARYFEDLAPQLLTGDPISFAEMLRRGIPARPVALISTAVAMSTSLRRKLGEELGCPVIDWYSLTETGPIGYLCPLGEGYHVLPHDLHVEVVRPDGSPAAPFEIGEIAVSGGRNPFLPLLRYRTGDHGRIDHALCACGDPMPRLLDLEGRAPVLFRSASGEIVNPVDLSRILREFPLVQHRLEQRADKSCELVVRPISESPGARPEPEALAAALRAVLGDLEIEVRLDPTLGDRDPGKIAPYHSAMLLED